LTKDVFLNGKKRVKSEAAVEARYNSLRNDRQIEKNDRQIEKLSTNWKMIDKLKNDWEIEKWLTNWKWSTNCKMTDKLKNDRSNDKWSTKWKIIEKLKN
jgi:O-methyltransferase involved in polyketide biosynthesis